MLSKPNPSFPTDYGRPPEHRMKLLCFKISPKKTYTDLVRFFYEHQERTLSGKLPVIFIEGFDINLNTPNSSSSVECPG
jgi:hypothetical protein